MFYNVFIDVLKLFLLAGFETMFLNSQPWKNQLHHWLWKMIWTEQKDPTSPQILFSAKNYLSEYFSIFPSEFNGFEVFVCPTDSGFVNELELVGNRHLFYYALGMGIRLDIKCS